jgi:hypothetical protein
MTYLPFLLLVFFLIVLKETYLDIKNTKFQLGIERTVFEIKIPKEITKTPLAMELVLSALHNTSGEST